MFCFHKHICESTQSLGLLNCIRISTVMSQILVNPCRPLMQSGRFDSTAGMYLWSCCRMSLVFLFYVFFFFVSAILNRPLASVAPWGRHFPSSHPTVLTMGPASCPVQGLHGASMKGREERVMRTKERVCQRHIWNCSIRKLCLSWVNETGGW